jgi:hypothetical protein
MSCVEITPEMAWLLAALRSWPAGPELLEDLRATQEWGQARARGRIMQSGELTGTGSAMRASGRGGFSRSRDCDGRTASVFDDRPCGRARRWYAVSSLPMSDLAVRGSRSSIGSFGSTLALWPFVGFIIRRSLGIAEMRVSFWVDGPGQGREAELAKLARGRGEGGHRRMHFR